MKVICIGDSITQGYGVPSKENWVELLNKNKGVEFINKGINGDTSGGMLSRFYRDVVDEKPRFTIIMGGANDFISGNTMGAVKSNIMAMVHQAYYNGITPILGISIKADIHNFREDWAKITDVDHYNYKILEYRKWILDFCDIFNVMYIDFCDEFENKITDYYGSYLNDGLHPSKEGHHVLADIAYEHINRHGIFK